MVGENHKISDMQFRRLLVLDWFAKGVLLLPALIRRVSAREFVFCLILGFALVLIYVRMLCAIGGRAKEGLSACMVRVVGPWALRLLSGLYLIYTFVNLLYLVRAFSEIGVLFVIPETSRELLIAMVLAGGAAVTAQGLEVRARTAAALYPILIYPMLFLILAGAFTMNPEFLSAGTVTLGAETWKAVGRVFCAFGGAGAFVFIMPQVTGKPEKAFRRGTAVTCACLLSILIVMAGVFGEGGLKAIPWPGVELMSSTELPGVFFQRWDVMFVGLLLTELFLAAGTSLYYLNLCGSQIWGHPGRPQILLWAVAALGGALWCQTYERAEGLYMAVNVWAVMGSILLLILLYLRQRRKRVGALILLLLAGLSLTGCQGRELEDRKFPTVLTFPDADPDLLQEERQRDSSKYLDYGQVKAVILEDRAVQDSERLLAVLEYLARSPQFARNLLVFQGDAGILAMFGDELEEEPSGADSQSEAQTDREAQADGSYLEDLYKNQPKETQREPVTLKDLLNDYYNQDRLRPIPRLCRRGEQVLLEAS